MSTIHIALRYFAEVDAAQEQDLLALLQEADHAHTAQHPESRRRQLLARAWRRQLLAAALNQAPAGLRFAREEQGKPYLAGQALSFNLSHSREAFALAWTEAGHALGLDIEDLNRRLRMQNLAAHAFTEQELARWQASQAQEDWFASWTRKEAVLKAQGMGIRINLNTVDTSSPLGRVEHRELGTWRVQSWKGDRQLMSLAWPADVAEPPIEILPAADWRPL